MSFSSLSNRGKQPTNNHYRHNIRKKVEEEEEEDEILLSQLQNNILWFCTYFYADIFSTLILQSHYLCG